MVRGQEIALNKIKKVLMQSGIDAFEFYRPLKEY
jgi:hypothetical protein